MWCQFLDNHSPQSIALEVIVVPVNNFIPFAKLPQQIDEIDLIEWDELGEFKRIILNIWMKMKEKIINYWPTHRESGTEPNTQWNIFLALYQSIA